MQLLRSSGLANLFTVNTRVQKVSPVHNVRRFFVPDAPGRKNRRRKQTWQNVAYVVGYVQAMITLCDMARQHVDYVSGSQVFLTTDPYSPRIMELSY